MRWCRNVAGSFRPIVWLCKGGEQEFFREICAFRLGDVLPGENLAPLDPSIGVFRVLFEFLGPGSSAKIRYLFRHNSRFSYGVRNTLVILCKLMVNYLYQSMED